MTRFALLGAGVALAHVAHSRRQASEKAVIHGFSARRHLLGQEVHNADGDLIGKIEDLILANRSVSHVILGVGGFLGVGAYFVAIPVADFTRRHQLIVLRHASKEAIRALPQFEYTQMPQ
jgi:PRC-barrel domain